MLFKLPHACLEPKLVRCSSRSSRQRQRQHGALPPREDGQFLGSEDAGVGG